MLMGRGMKHHRGMVGLKYFVQTLFVADGTDQCNDGRFGAVFIAQLGFQLIGTVFVNVKDQQASGLVTHDLTAKLAADGTASAGDQNDLVVKILGNLGVVQLNLIAGQEVGGVQLTEAGGHRVAVFIHGLGVR